jgi:septum formation protein
MQARAPSSFTLSAVAAGVAKFVDPPRLILGSKSGSRRAILAAAGASFETLVPNIDEKAIGDRLSDSPLELVKAIAIAKSDAILTRIASEEESDSVSDDPRPAGVVLLTCDQVVTYQGAIREKPSDAHEARLFIDSYSAAPCGTVGGYCVHDLDSGRRAVGVDVTRIHFRPLPSPAVDDLVACDDVLHCAGALMIEHPALSPHIDTVEGGLDAVMGLSVACVQRLLEELQLKSGGLEVPRL